MRIKIDNIDIISDNFRTIPVIRKGKPTQVSNADYAKCKKSLAELFNAARVNRNLPTYNSHIRITINAFTFKDITNIVKVIVDALELGKVIKNDRYVTEVHLFKNAIKRGERERVTVDVSGMI